MMQCLGTRGWTKQFCATNNAESGNEYDVFLSFRGPDNRKEFTDCLYHRLKDAGIHTFRDDEELRVGEEIGPELMRAIKQSKISIPIFSKGYASSKWCLKEVAEMVKRMDETKHMIMPIFLDVTPNEVQHQTGSYAEAFSQHWENYDFEIVQEWRSALWKIVKLKGLELQKEARGKHGEFIKLVLATVLNCLKKAYLDVNEILVGIDDHVEAVKTLLEAGTQGVQIVGIWGMGGIGKTTLAKVVYNQLLDKFESSCFLKDIRKTSSQHNGLACLQSKLVSDILNCECKDFADTAEGKQELKKRLRGKRAIILLDDVDQIDQLKALVGDHAWFGPGSRVIITTREKKVLELLQVSNTYEVTLLSEDQAFELFCKHAFVKGSPTASFTDLSRDIVSTTGCLPLALEVIGSSLSTKSGRKEIWRDTLKKLKMKPHMKVREKLRISYDDLDHEQQQIFLDIACFFIGTDSRIAIIMWDDCGFFPKVGIDILRLKSLVKITDDNKLWMHDQVRDLGREIVEQENYKQPRLRSRLWRSEVAMRVLERQPQEGMTEVEAINLEGCHNFKYDQFKNLLNLRIFQLDKAILCGNFERLLPDLRWLSWHFCTSNPTLPTNLDLRNLIVLDLSRSMVSEDWAGWSLMKVAAKLKVLNLTSCQELRKTPDFSAFPALVRLILASCCNLVFVDPSIEQLSSLVSLDIRNCTSLKHLPLLDSMDALTELLVDGTSLREFSISVDPNKLESLGTLSANNCRLLGQLSDSLGSLKKLQLLSLHLCESLGVVPNSIGQSISLVELSVSKTRVSRLSGSIGNITLLKAEFMEHDEKHLPIDIPLLGALAEKFQAFAKSLHYKEMEFEGACSKKMDANPVAVVEDLIHIYSQLHQHEAAVGILTYAQQNLDVQLKESWYEKLQRWDDALRAYTLKASQATSAIEVLDATLGRMRCLAALARWEELNNLCKEYWTPAEPATRLEMAPMAANAAWNMGEWDQMAEYVNRLDDGNDSKLRGLGNNTASSDGSSCGTFFRAVLLVRMRKYDEAREYVERARKCLATELAALVLESYERAYSNMVRVQQLLELEEVIDYCTLPMGNLVAEGRRALIRNMWYDRIKGAKRNVEVWQGLLAVRALVLPPTEDVETWLKFSSLCQKSSRISQARSTLIKLLQFDPETRPEKVHYHGPPQVMLAYLKYQWSLGDDLKRKEAFARLQNLAMELSNMPIQSVSPTGLMSSKGPTVPLIARVYLKLGSWQRALSPGLDDESIKEILSAFGAATHCAPQWVKAWHTWALFNTTVMSHYTLRGYPGIAGQYVVEAVTGYFHSISCAANAKGVDDSLQDILRLLTYWFNHGATVEVQRALQEGFSLVNINTWLAVLPQIIARIHSNNRAVRELIQSLLVRIGQSHPQALMYPLLVACKSISNLRKAAAQEVIDKVRRHRGDLVDQAQLVSRELIRVAILWHEMWHEALEEASRLCFGEHNIEAMLKVLEPLHEMLEEGAMRRNTSIKERAFIEAYHVELLEAYECCMKYKRTGKDAELTQAWDLYYHVFIRIDKQLSSLTTLDLQSVSPELLDCRDLELAVPGTYLADSPVVTIASFAPQLVVITSKQQPRKLTIYGSDGEDYTFLLKGHEDLRQDERVMQLFGLVNTLLENSRKTGEKDLSIRRYSVIPLSPNSGLIGWVPNCDTLHQLIREYRENRKITLNQEHKYMLSFAPDYDHLPLISKVEVFEYALQNTEGNDLARVLWLKSRTSEIWLDRRTNYTRSLAVMSMVGYLLGLGDRHPSNLMLHRYSGKILHIDFGDCFEAAMSREKFPEKVPFRLTRMLVKAMEVSGIEGNFRSTCENVMQVLRANKDSVMAMMEAFVHDPLINWRLFNFTEVPQMATFANTMAPAVVNGEESTQNRELAQPQRGARERELLQAVNQLGDANEFLNERAVVVMARMSNKLTGRDFLPSPASASSPQHAIDHSNLITGDSREVEHGLSVKLQVQKLIIQATSPENLCQNYVGWCPFW